MKLIISATLLLITIAHAFSDGLPEGTKLYCNEVNYVKYDSNWEVLQERTNSNKRALFIIGDEYIYQINEYGHMDWNIFEKNDYRTKAKSENPEDHYRSDIAFFHETESVRVKSRSGSIFLDEVKRRTYDWNCSKIKHEMY